jgi:acyl-CoA synthetase (NDP forming)
VPEGDLAKFFSPKSIAIVGVPRKPDRFGGGSFLNKLVECGFPGKLFPINPKADEIFGLKAYPHLASLPEAPDLAIVSIAAAAVPRVLEECASAGIRHIHILSSGFKEIGTDEGARLEERVKQIAAERGLLVIGPNCMGPYCPAAKLTAWGAIPGKSGPVGIISQSGGITQRLTEYLYSLGVGTEKAVSIGNAAVLDSPDYLEYMARDERIRVIAMYLESIADGRRFFQLVRKITRRKPVVIWKGGESAVGSQTAASHTGKLAGKPVLWEALFRQSGITRVQSMNEWVDAILALCLLPRPEGKKVFLIGGGGGNSVGNSDTCIREGLEIPRLSEGAMDKLRETVPVAGSIAGNPLDMWRIFDDPDYLRDILALAYDEPNVDMLIVDRLIPRRAFHMEDRADSTPQLASFMRNNLFRKPTVITADSDGGDSDLAAKGAALRAQFTALGIPAFPSLQRAARALAHLYDYYARLI